MTGSGTEIVLENESLYNTKWHLNKYHFVGDLYVMQIYNIKITQKPNLN